MELERVLTKLRYDESVSGYALFTNDGLPFLSFSLPEEILPVIEGTMKIHSESLKLMNIMTGEGTVVLARVDPSWVLGVLFRTEESLGMALQKTKDVVDLLETVELPPPPKPAEAVDVSPGMTLSEVASDASSAEEGETAASAIPLEEIDVRYGCIVLKGSRYDEAMRIDSALYQELKSVHANVGMDILMMVDDKRTVFKIAENLGRRIDPLVETIKWCVSRSILDVECPEEQSLGETEIVELPLFEGDLKKAKKEHRAVLELCDGNRTLHEIADSLGILYFQALQSVVLYRGKSVKFIRKAKHT